MRSGRALHAVSQNGWPDDHITNIIITRERELAPVSVGEREWDVLHRGSPDWLLVDHIFLLYQKV